METNKKTKMNFSKSRIFPNLKRGLSGVITVVILIALVFALVSIVWVVVNNLIQSELEDVESCFGVFGEVTINSRYTCYDSISNEFQFSINLKDIEVGNILISISGDGAVKSFTITNEDQQIANLANYKSTGFGTDQIKLPGKNAGLTYVTDAFSNAPDSIEIAPIINGKQCDVSDSLSEIDNCLSLA